MEYRKGSHTAYNIQYHFVWVTKYRYHVLEGEVKLRVREIIRQICQQHELLIEQGDVSKDHVHSLVSAPTHMSASQIMQKIKGRSSRMLQQEFPHLKKRYWGRHIWARGYFCATVGPSHWSNDPWLHWRPCGKIPGRLLYMWMRIDPRLQWASAFVVYFSLTLDFQSVIWIHRRLAVVVQWQFQSTRYAAFFQFIKHQIRL